MSELKSVQEILSIVLRDRVPLEIVDLDPADALGFVLAEAVISKESLPRFSNSAMDGYAIRSKDTKGDGAFLHVVGSTMAGEQRSGGIGENQAIRIMTGSPLPDGADAVCMLEETSQEGESVHIPRVFTPGTNIRLPGEDIREGMEVFKESTLLGPAHLGVLAGIGVRRVRVYRRPIVGVLSTGDELAERDQSPRPGQIRDTNRPALLGMIIAVGATPLDLGIAGDDENALIRLIEDVSQRCDVLITSGGASDGDRDTIASALAKVKPRQMVLSIRAAIRPAKPLVFAELGPSRVPVFGLPGNPVSALVAFELFVRPTLRVLAGDRGVFEGPIAAVAETDFERSFDGRVHYVCAHVRIDESGLLSVTRATKQGAHMLASMAHSNALVVLADGNGARAGERVDIHLLPGNRLNLA